MNVPTSVPPGGTATFTVPFCAPVVEGQYRFRWQMFWGGQRFGEILDVPLTVNHNGAAIVGSSAFVTNHPWPGADMLDPGQTGTFWIILRNTGTRTWRPGYCLAQTQPGAWAAPAVCLTQPVAPGQDWNFFPQVTAPNSPGRWNIGYQMRTDGGIFSTAFGPHIFGTLGITRPYRASTGFSSVQGANSWFYRSWNGGTPPNRWEMLDWVGDHWQRTPASQLIYANSMRPGDDYAVGRFWKSPVSWTVHIHLPNLYDLEPNCGDGVEFKIVHNTELIFQRFTQNTGSGNPVTAFINRNASLNDTIRFVIAPGNNNNCDFTHLDPTIYILPPPGVGASPTPQPIDIPAFEFGNP